MGTAEKNKDTEENMGEILYALRKQHQFTLEQLAQELHVSRQTVSSWEKNRTMPGKENLMKLSQLYDVSADVLLGVEKRTKETEKKETEKKEDERAEEYPPFRIVEGYMERWENRSETRKHSLLAVMAAAVIATIWIPPLGIMFCIGTFLVSRKWKIHNIWLDILIFVCLGINAYYMYAILGHIVFDFGYGTVTPL